MTYQTKKLRDVVELKYGKGISRTDRNSDGKYPVYGANGILGYSNKYLVEGEAIIVGRKGSAGEITRVSRKFWPSDVTYFVLGNKQIDIDYLFHLLKSLNLQRLAVGVKPGINRNRVYELEIPLPPLSEQKKIVARLEGVLQKINEAKKLRAEARENADSLLPAELHKIFNEGKKRGWKEKELEGLIDTITPPEKIQKKDFKQIGKYPVIDQSQDEISGWTDDSSSLVNIGKPVVIFGDHTCAVKYSKRPFVQGADGIKILSTNQDLLPRFLFIVLKNNPIESEGYRRHFSKLKQYKILLPPLAEQKRIIKHLDSLSPKLQKLQEYQKSTQSDLLTLEQVILQKAFL